MYYVYILTNFNNTVLYTGFSGNLAERVTQHKAFQIEGFTKKYRASKLIYYEQYENVEDAKRRERTIKKWKREWKENLINKANPQWDEMLIL